MNGILKVFNNIIIIIIIIIIINFKRKILGDYKKRYWTYIFNKIPAYRTQGRGPIELGLIRTKILCITGTN